MKKIIVVLLLVVLFVSCQNVTGYTGSKYPYTITTVDGEHTFVVTGPENEPHPISDPGWIEITE